VHDGNNNVAGETTVRFGRHMKRQKRLVLRDHDENDDEVEKV
jgi:hypothetical protein